MAGWFRERSDHGDSSWQSSATAAARQRRSGRKGGSMRYVVLIASVAALLAVGGCATAQPGAGQLPVSEYTGHFTGDANWFRPCAGAAGDTLWWITFMGGAVGQWEQLKQAGRVKTDE